MWALLHNKSVMGTIVGRLFRSLGAVTFREPVLELIPEVARVWLVVLPEQMKEINQVMWFIQ